MNWIKSEKKAIPVDTCSRCKNDEQHAVIIQGNHGIDYKLCEACYEEYQRRWDVFIHSYVKEGEEFRDLIISEINKAIQKVNENNSDYFISWDKKIDIKKIVRFKED
jgi:hypothetical protein